MNASTEMLIDVGLNVLGFIAAGGFLMVINSMFRRNETREIAVSNANLTVSDTVNENEPVERRSKVEFVNFQKSNTPVISRKNTESTPDNSSRFQRNRLEVIKQAREMLNAGKGAADIRSKLPIAEAELNMINQQRSGRGGRGAANDQ